MKFSQHSLKTNNRHLRAGFTLIEMVVVIAMIAILAGLSIGGFRWWSQKSAEDKTDLLFREVGRSLESYYKDYGTYPQSTTANDASTIILYESLFGDADHDGKPDDGATVYLESLDPDRKGSARMVTEIANKYVLIDGWNNPIYYLSGAPAADMNNPDYDLWSKGLDTANGETSDDIRNW